MSAYKYRLRFSAKIAKVMALIMTLQAVFPMQLFALTSGPAQPEFSEFEPVGTTEMVDLFSGDFVYNIPLFELPGPDGGYPFNLSYHSGVTMDQEATWVGLGWTLNHGAITRTMRGFPDDFNGEKIERKMRMTPNRTWKLGLKAHFELFGVDPAEDAPPALEDGGNRLDISLGLSVSVNNYRGVGISASLGLSPNFISTNKKGEYQGTNGGASLGLSVGSENGANLTGGISFANIAGRNSANISFSKSGRDGMQSFGLGFTRSIVIPKDYKKGKKEMTGALGGGGISSTASYSFSKSAYSPQVTMPYRGTNLTASLEGGAYPGIFANIGPEFDLSYNDQRLKNNDRWIKAPAYGYFHLRTDIDDGLSDFNREKDGPIYKNTPNLATPITTPDIYSVAGQGTGGMYRAYRSDIGILSDPKVESKTGGGEFGVDLGVGTGVDGGADIGGNFAVSGSRRWNGPANYRFETNRETFEDYEPFYFKAAGEMTSEAVGTYDYLGNEDALRMRISPLSGMFAPSNLVADASGNFLETGERPIGGTALTSNRGKRDDRKPRANSIQHITNGELLGPSATEALNEYKVEYHELNPDGSINFDAATSLIRNPDKKDQFAGMTALQPNGMRYVYALPVKNMEHQEVSFAIPGANAGDCSQMPITTDAYTVNNGEPRSQQTDREYHSHTKMPEYAHSYLLTSVLGADYVDMDEIPGPSNGDYGYWVKFNYVKTNSENDPYRWKTPFEGANFLMGNYINGSDDKGMIVSGEREQYYLASAESRTHYAEFNIATRTDARGAASLFQKNNAKGAYSYKLNSIKLFSKLERSTNPNTTPIKTVVFNYAEGNDTEALCKGIENGEGGKLTLTGVHFEYEDSERGRLSPYTFTYNANNPGYSPLNYDRWGTYKPMDNCQKLNDPYSEQDRINADRDAAAWSLSQIQLPSGASINVDYESDDYAYVQDEVAMRMFKPEATSSNYLQIETDKNINNDEGDLTIRFPLETDEDGFLIDDIDKYFDGLHGMIRDETTGELKGGQLYFKILSTINSGTVTADKDFVSGYAEIESYGLDGNYGVIELKPVKLNGNNYHPFAAAAWQHLRINHPQGAIEDVDLNQVEEVSFGDAIDRFAGALGQVKAVFSNFYKYCASKGFGKYIDVDQSFIRLCEPDRIKLGGGCRVKQIRLEDNWNIGEDSNTENDVSSYGQYFEYTKESGEVDEDGNPILISSGVATNEPSIGGEECALRYAKIWNNQGLLFASDENLMVEYPINESYYPGASVGYSKVTVKSLATHFAMQETPPAGLPTDFGTTGLTVNEFYTAKDFPVITKETMLSRSITTPQGQMMGLANIKYDGYTGSQGYVVILNDMHGKPYKVTHYGLDQNNKLINQKLSEVVYTYSEGDVEVNNVGERQKTVRTLNNVVPVLEKLQENRLQPDAVVTERLLGVDYEMFMDMRENYSQGIQGNIRINAKYTPPFIFGFFGWPKMNMDVSNTRTAVVNKIVRKSGILIKTDAYDGQSHITTSNKVFDALTGEPLLTSVNNSFDDKIYNYNIPARMSYERMGAAYENWGTEFEGYLSIDSDCGYFTLNSITNDFDFLVEGDECIMVDFAIDSPEFNCTDYEELCNNRRFIYTGKKGDIPIFENEKLDKVGPLAVPLRMMIVRSGNRNHLSAKSGNIAALSNPLEGRSVPTVFNTIINLPSPEGNKNTVVDYSRINNVLNASAVTYQDAWDLEREINTTTNKVTYVQFGAGSSTTNYCIDVVVDGTGYAAGCPQGSAPGVEFSYQVDGVEYTELYTNVTGLIEETIYCGISAPGSLTWDIIPADNCGQFQFNAFATVRIETIEGNPPTLTESEIVKATEDYHIGQRGIWRPHKSFTYVEDRTPNALVDNDSELNIRTEGTFDDLVLFDWTNPFFPQAPAASKWKQTNEITKYSRNGEEVENRDIIGLYSTAHYGYADNLPTAVAANAAYHEIGFEGFEEVAIGSTSKDNRNGGLDFECSSAQTQTNLTYNILGIYNEGSDIVWIDKEGFDNMRIPDNVFLLLEDNQGNEYEVAAGALQINAADPNALQLETYFRGNVTQITLEDRASCGLPANTVFTGRVVLQYKNDFPDQFTCNASVQDAEAHTGEHSLYVFNSAGFEQKTTQLIKGRKYVISAWVKAEDNTPVPNYPSLDVSIKIDNRDFYTSGEMIEGWQRIEGVFTYSGNPLSLLLNVRNGEAFYFDDIRIYPEDGSIQTYVYNPQDYRLQAVLDQNNYATFYHYDEEGNLFLIKKETAKGIKTIQETREFVKDTSNP